jgi:hypothetical protein
MRLIDEISAQAIRHARENHKSFFDQSNGKANVQDDAWQIELAVTACAFQEDPTGRESELRDLQSE